MPVVDPGSLDEAFGRLFKEESQDGKVVVRLSAGSMEAYLLVSPPLGEGKPVTVEEAMAALREAGVVVGIDQKAVQRAVEEGASPAAGERQPVLVATGKAPIHGRDAAVEFSSDLAGDGGVPKLKEDGTADFYDLGLVRNVRKGTVLAKKTPSTFGLAGTNVLGEKVPARDGKDLPWRLGRGAVLSEDGLAVLAETDGHAALAGDKITVSPVYEIRGNVDPSTGNVDFVGSVIVRGNVHSGFSVRAGTSVEVFGGIEGGTVEAGGDVTVRYGIQGGGKGHVIARGTVKAKFIENATVRAGGDVIVSDGILHSQIRAGGKVQVQGKRGCVIGGRVQAQEEVSARVIGSSLATATEIEVGVSPELREEWQQARLQLAETEEQLKKTGQAINLLREQEKLGVLDQAKKEMLLKAVRSQYHLIGQRESLLKRKLELEVELGNSRKGRVRAGDIVFSGVRITIGSEAFVVDDPLYRALFYLSDQGEVTWGPL